MWLLPVFLCFLSIPSSHFVAGQMRNKRSADPCSGACTTGEVCNDATGTCVPVANYDDACVISKQCVGPRQICNTTTSKCDCFERTVYNASESGCVLPCWFTYDTASLSGRQYTISGDDYTTDRYTFADARQMCRQEGGYLLTLLKYQDEVDYINYKFESGVDMDREVWLAMEQQDRFKYLWPDVNITVEFDPDTVESYDGHYAHFYDTEASDRYSYSGPDCNVEKGMDDGFGWEDNSCTNTRFVVCECPSAEKFEEVFIKGNKEYLLDPDMQNFDKQ